MSTPSLSNLAKLMKESRERCGEQKKRRFIQTSEGRIKQRQSTEDGLFHSTNLMMETSNDTDWNSSHETFGSSEFSRLQKQQGQYLSALNEKNNSRRRSPCNATNQQGTRRLSSEQYSRQHHQPGRIRQRGSTRRSNKYQLDDLSDTADSRMKPQGSIRRASDYQANSISDTVDSRHRFTRRSSRQGLDSFTDDSLNTFDSENHFDGSYSRERPDSDDDTECDSLHLDNKKIPSDDSLDTFDSTKNKEKRMPGKISDSGDDQNHDLPFFDDGLDAWGSNNHTSLAEREKTQNYSSDRQPLQKRGSMLSLLNDSRRRNSEVSRPSLYTRKISTDSTMNDSLGSFVDEHSRFNAKKRASFVQRGDQRLIRTTHASQLQKQESISSQYYDDDSTISGRSSFASRPPRYTRKSSADSIMSGSLSSLVDQHLRLNTQVRTSFIQKGDRRLSNTKRASYLERQQSISTLHNDSTLSSNSRTSPEIMLGKGSTRRQSNSRNKNNLLFRHSSKTSFGGLSTGAKLTLDEYSNGKDDFDVNAFLRASGTTQTMSHSLGRERAIKQYDDASCGCDETLAAASSSDRISLMSTDRRSSAVSFMSKEPLPRKNSMVSFMSSEPEPSQNKNRTSFRRSGKMLRQYNSTRSLLTNGSSGSLNRIRNKSNKIRSGNQNYDNGYRNATWENPIDSVSDSNDSKKKLDKNTKSSRRSKDRMGGLTGRDLSFRFLNGVEDRNSSSSEEESEGSMESLDYWAKKITSVEVDANRNYQHDISEYMDLSANYFNSSGNLLDEASESILGSNFGHSERDTLSPNPGQSAGVESKAVNVEAKSEKTKLDNSEETNIPSSNDKEKSNRPEQEKMLSQCKKDDTIFVENQSEAEAEAGVLLAKRNESGSIETNMSSANEEDASTRKESEVSKVSVALNEETLKQLDALGEQNNGLDTIEDDQSIDIFTWNNLTLSSSASTCSESESVEKIDVEETIMKKTNVFRNHYEEVDSPLQNSYSTSLDSLERSKRSKPKQTVYSISIASLAVCTVGCQSADCQSCNKTITTETITTETITTETTTIRNSRPKEEDSADDILRSMPPPIRRIRSISVRSTTSSRSKISAISKSSLRNNSVKETEKAAKASLSRKVFTMWIMVLTFGVFPRKKKNYERNVAKSKVSYRQQNK